MFRFSDLTTFPLVLALIVVLNLTAYFIAKRFNKTLTFNRFWEGLKLPLLSVTVGYWTPKLLEAMYKVICEK